MAKGVKRSGLFDDLDPSEKKVNPSENEHVYEHKHEHVPPVRERKTSHIHLLTYPSITAKLDKYAKANGLSRAEAFERIVSEFLD